MLHPDQFRVNEAWIAIRVNDSFIIAENEPHDIFVLMDAASAYVLGFVLSKVADQAPKQADVEALFQKAWAAKSEWAENLILPEKFSAKEVFTAQAEKHGFKIQLVSLRDLAPIIDPLKESFSQTF